MKPPDLNYSKIFSTKDKNHELPVVPPTQTPPSSSSAAGAQFFQDLCKTFSENELKDKITRTKTTLVSLAHIVPDKGAKMKENLKAPEAELEHRKHEIEIINKDRSAGIMLVKNKKKHKILHTTNVGVGEDKISNLPDALIHHILSLLPTKCAMSTCILSKRWKYLANSIPILDFRNWRADAIKDRELETRRFINFLDAVFYLHDKPNIQKFYLGGDHLFDEFQLYKWISILVKRKVEELFISGRFRESIMFPLSFFTCDSLTVLELIRLSFHVPNMVSFPRLKLLKLTTINFVDGISTNKLLSNCPILEELSLIHCGGLEFDALCISNFELKNLHIRSCSFAKTTLKICAPNLTTISYKGELPENFVFGSSLSLDEADIHVYTDGEISAKTFVLIKLFEELSNVKILKMSGHSFLVLSQVDILLTDLPAFNNLIHLEVSSEFERASVWPDSFSTLRILFRFLQLSPNLETIVFDTNMYCCSNEEDEGYWSLEPKCSLLHLRSVKFSRFYGMAEELDAIKLFLKCAGVLEKFTIVASPPLSRNYEAQTKVMRQLLTFPKPINCVINFLLSSESI